MYSKGVMPVCDKTTLFYSSSVLIRRWKWIPFEGTFADIFLTKVKGCDIKELYERHKLYDIEEKIIPYVKRNEGVQQRMATALSEFPPGQFMMKKMRMIFV